MVSMIGYLQPFVGFLFEHLDKFCSLPIGWLCAWHIFCFCWLTMSRTETVVPRDFQEHNAAKMHTIIFAVKWKKIKQMEEMRQSSQAITDIASYYYHYVLSPGLRAVCKFYNAQRQALFVATSFDIFIFHCYISKLMIINRLCVCVCSIWLYYNWRFLQTHAQTHWYN